MRPEAFDVSIPSRSERRTMPRSPRSRIVVITSAALRPSRPAGLMPAHHQQAAVKRRTGITVGHENLRREVDLDKPHPTRGFSSHQANTPATNVLSRYS